jgi:hypothetical protein
MRALRIFVQVRAFAFFHVNFGIDKIGIEKISDFFLRKRIAIHHFARAAPGGVGVHKNELVLASGFSQNFFPGALCKLNALGLQRADGDTACEKKNDLLHWLNYLLLSC